MGSESGSADSGGNPDRGGLLSQVVVSLCLLLRLLVMPVVAGAESTPALVELAPNLSLGGARADGIAAPDLAVDKLED